MSSNQVIRGAVESAPPVTYATFHLMGVSMPDWVAFFTLAYILLQSAHLIWRWRRRVFLDELDAEADE